MRVIKDHIEFSNSTGELVYCAPSKTIRNEKVVFCDVDDTLILHLSEKKLKKYDTIEVQDPLNKSETITVGVHAPMVRLLKEEYARGAHVIVWSMGGYEWAESVIKALGLYDHVHQIMSKPIVYFDDKPIEEWLRYRVYLKPNTVYKNIKSNKGDK